MREHDTHTDIVNQLLSRPKGPRELLTMFAMVCVAITGHKNECLRLTTFFTTEITMDLRTI